MNNKIQLTEVTDSVTLSYLKGQISFQEYEILIENQKHANEISSVPFNTAEELDQSSIEGTSSSFDPILNGLKPLGNRKRNENSNSSSSSNSNNKILSTSIDRYLNLSNIISNDDEEGTEEEEDDDENSSKKIHENNFDAYDDNTKDWEHFDIETLNFDNFIKANSKSSESNYSNNSKSSKKNANNDQLSFKRKKDDLDQNDMIEIKSKRRVSSNLKIMYFLNKLLNK